jgi:hypothetical protein
MIVLEELSCLFEGGVQPDRPAGTIKGQEGGRGTGKRGTQRITAIVRAACIVIKRAPCQGLDEL